MNTILQMTTLPQYMSEELAHIKDLSPQEVLLAVVGIDARSYEGDRTSYNAIRNYAFSYTGWQLTPTKWYTNHITQEQINAAPKWLLMDSILNACENWYENNANDDRTFMELVGSSMGGMSEIYTIKGDYIK